MRYWQWNNDHEEVKLPKEIQTVRQLVDHFGMPNYRREETTYTCNGFRMYFLKNVSESIYGSPIVGEYTFEDQP